MAERWEDLQCQGLKILQDDDLYSFTSDAVILANFVRLKPNETAVEIGGGSGVISILLSAKNSFKKIKIFEIQEKMQKICEKNIIFNNLSDKIELICDDVKNFRKYFEVGSVDVVFSNPPYFEVSKFSQNSVKKVAKEEVCLNLTDLISCAKNLLKFGGRFYLCYPAGRLQKLLAETEKNGLSLKRLFFTENGKGVINLLVAEFKKGGGEGVKILPNLVTNSSDGKFLEELKTRKFLK